MTGTPANAADYELSGAAPVQVISYDENGHEEVHPRTLSEARGIIGRRRTTWINVDEVEDPAVLRCLELEFGIHPLTVEDVKNLRQRPKVEEYPEYTYIVTQMVRRDAEGELITEQVSLILGDGYVLTIQDKPGDVFDTVRQRIRQGRPRISKAGPDYLVYALLDAIVDAFFPIVEEIGAKAEALEDRAVEEATIQMRAELQAMRRELLILRRVAWPQRDALTVLERGENERIGRDARTYLRDVTDHATRVLDFVETNRELMAALMDLYLASLQQRTNEVMKILTIVTTIFIPLTFIVGIYGMNFDYMPELRSPWGYPAVLAFMLALGLFMFLMFRRKGWF